MSRNDYPYKGELSARGISQVVTAISSIHESEDRGQLLLNEVVQLFADLLNASGASMPMIKDAMASAIYTDSDKSSSTTFTDLGSILRDCMEVMCTWRRDIDLVDGNGDPAALSVDGPGRSFKDLWKKSRCRRSPSEVLSALVDFGAVSIGADGMIKSETPTFILGRASSGGRLATDGLLKQLQGFLLCVHRNVLSVAGHGSSKFERACTVTVAHELEPVFAQLVRCRGQEFIDSIDEWLERNQKLESPSGKYVELGAGAYFIDHGERQGRKALIVRE
jgi:hypothetical protein